MNETVDSTPASGAGSLARPGLGDILDGRYEIQGEIGRGGFATVYRAHHRFLGHSVALKILHPQEDAQERRALQRRMSQEARILASVQHPHVVRALDAHLEDPSYIVMELLQGHELDQELRDRGPLSPERALRLLLPLLEGLQEVHQRGIVHKDLKPSNLFLVHPGTPQEKLVLLDFSAAGPPDHSELPRLTGRFELVGTLQYMSPEYIADQHLSSATDIYQLGLTLAEMLTGQPAVVSEDPRECMLLHCHGRLEISEALLQSPLGEVLRRCTSVDPKQRYADAGQLHQALQALAQSVPSEALVPATLATPTRQTRREVPPRRRSPDTRPLWQLTAPEPPQTSVSQAPRTTSRPHWALWSAAGAALTLTAALASLALFWALGDVWSMEEGEEQVSSAITSPAQATPKRSTRRSRR